ncbi:hypothetical protein FOL47_001809, partial [Perkinsus chesapeaki]
PERFQNEPESCDVAILRKNGSIETNAANCPELLSEEENCSEAESCSSQQSDHDVFQTPMPDENLSESSAKKLGTEARNTYPISPIVSSISSRARTPPLRERLRRKTRPDYKQMENGKRVMMSR